MHPDGLGPNARVSEGNSGFSTKGKDQEEEAHAMRFTREFWYVRLNGEWFGFKDFDTAVRFKLGLI